MNSIVGLIFNEKVAEKWNLWVCKQCTDALFTVDLVILCGWKKKNQKTQTLKTLDSFESKRTHNVEIISSWVRLEDFQYKFVQVPVGLVEKRGILSGGHWCGAGHKVSDDKVNEWSLGK